MGIMADCCGPAIAEKSLPLLRMWDRFAKHDPTDRTLLPLMESLASIAVTCGMNFQPYPLESFDNAMCIIESVTLLLTASGDIIENEEDVDPIYLMVSSKVWVQTFPPLCSVANGTDNIFSLFFSQCASTIFQECG
jgi:hypothetical protein